MKNCGSLMKADLALTARLGTDGLKDGNWYKLEEAMIFYAKNEEIVKSVTGFNWVITHV
jgi:hypothetical protein